MEHVSDSEIGAEIESEGVERVGNAWTNIRPKSCAPLCGESTTVSDRSPICHVDFHGSSALTSCYVWFGSVEV